jgi:hypothetical protein
VKLPSPREGWRVFAGEVGVIVLGILLALGAQQVAENVQTRSDVHALRQAINHEVGFNLYAYDVRTRLSDCNMRRIRELVTWLRETPSDEPLPQLDLQGPGALMPYQSIWDSRDGAVFAHVPAEARQKYAEFYDELSGNLDRLREEQDAWVAIKGYELPGTVSLEDRREIYRLLARAFVADRTLAVNLPVSKKIADALGVRPIRPDNVSDDIANPPAGCESIFIPAKVASS